MKIKINDSVSFSKPTKKEIEEIKNLINDIGDLARKYDYNMICSTLINIVCEQNIAMEKMHFMEMISTVFDRHQSIKGIM